MGNCECLTPTLEQGGLFPDDFEKMTNSDGSSRYAIDVVQASQPSATFTSGGSKFTFNLVQILATPLDGTCNPRASCSFEVTFVFSGTLTGSPSSDMPPVNVKVPFGQCVKMSPKNIVDLSSTSSTAEYEASVRVDPGACGAATSETLSMLATHMNPRALPATLWSAASSNVLAPRVRFACANCDNAVCYSETSGKTMVVDPVTRSVTMFDAGSGPV